MAANLRRTVSLDIEGVTINNIHLRYDKVTIRLAYRLYTYVNYRLSYMVILHEITIKMTLIK